MCSRWLRLLRGRRRLLLAVAVAAAPAQCSYLARPSLRELPPRRDQTLCVAPAWVLWALKAGPQKRRPPGLAASGAPAAAAAAGAAGAGKPGRGCPAAGGWRARGRPHHRPPPAAAPPAPGHVPPQQQRRPPLPLQQLGWPAEQPAAACQRRCWALRPRQRRPPGPPTAACPQRRAAACRARPPPPASSAPACCSPGCPRPHPRAALCAAGPRWPPHAPAAAAPRVLPGCRCRCCCRRRSASARSPPWQRDRCSRRSARGERGEIPAGEPGCGGRYCHAVRFCLPPNCVMLTSSPARGSSQGSCTMAGCGSPGRALRAGPATQA